MIVVAEPLQLDWDDGNSGKNKSNHNGEDWECEEVFFDPKKAILKDKLHSDQEEWFQSPSPYTEHVV